MLRSMRLQQHFLRFLVTIDALERNRLIPSLYFTPREGRELDEENLNPLKLRGAKKMKRIWEFSIEMFVSFKGGENLSGQNIGLFLA